MTERKSEAPSRGTACGRAAHSEALAPFAQPVSDTRFFAIQSWPSNHRRAAWASATRSRALRTLRSLIRHCGDSPRVVKLSGNRTANPADDNRSPQSWNRCTILPERLTRPPHPCRATTLGNGPGPCGLNNTPWKVVPASVNSTDSFAPAVSLAITIAKDIRTEARRIMRIPNAKSHIARNLTRQAAPVNPNSTDDTNAPEWVWCKSGLKYAPPGDDPCSIATTVRPPWLARPRSSTLTAISR